MSALAPLPICLSIAVACIAGGALLGLWFGAWWAARPATVLHLSSSAEAGPHRWRRLLADPAAQRAIVRVLAAAIGFGIKAHYARDVPAEQLEPALLALIQGANALFDLILGTMAATGVIGLRRGKP